jgi:hypothetical protein
MHPATAPGRKGGLVSITFTVDPSGKRFSRSSRYTVETSWTQGLIGAHVQAYIDGTQSHLLRFVRTPVQRRLLARRQERLSINIVHV